MGHELGRAGLCAAWRRQLLAAGAGSHQAGSGQNPDPAQDALEFNPDSTETTQSNMWSVRCAAIWFHARIANARRHSAGFPAK